jgi:transcription initiation factor TFIIIB Brf1 subunit/transcription initiation factor TFIIB
MITLSNKNIIKTGMFKKITFSHKPHEPEKDAIAEPECTHCGGSDICEDPDIGTYVCSDCGTSSANVLDHKEDNYNSVNNGTNKATRCNVPVSDLCPNAGTHLIISSKNSSYQKWGKVAYKDRKILEIKKLNEHITKGIFVQSIMDDIIKITKICRAEHPSKKNMDIPFLAASSFYSCLERNIPKTIDEIKTIYSIKEKTEIAKFTDALTIVEGIIQQGTYIISIKEVPREDPSITYAEGICKALELTPGQTNATLLILTKLTEKNILQNVIIKNKVAVVIYFVINNSVGTPVTLDAIIEKIGSKSTATIIKHYNAIKTDYTPALLKYIARAMQ